MGQTSGRAEEDERTGLEKGNGSWFITDAGNELIKFFWYIRFKEIL